MFKLLTISLPGRWTSWRLDLAPIIPLDIVNQKIVEHLRCLSIVKFSTEENNFRIVQVNSHGEIRSVTWILTRTTITSFESLNNCAA